MRAWLLQAPGPAVHTAQSRAAHGPRPPRAPSRAPRTASHMFLSPTLTAGRRDFFTAYCLPDMRCVTRYTVLKLPVPSTFSCW